MQISILGIFSVILLILIQIGINFVTISKAESDYTVAHSTHYHNLEGEVISSKERKVLEKLRSAYQMSYLSLGVF